jgi:hypothetical protein
MMWSIALKHPYSTLFWRSFKRSWPRRFIPRRFDPELRARLIPSWLHPRLRDRAMTGNEKEVLRLRGYGDRQEFAPRALTYPCLHRPLVDFLHVVPFGQKLRCGESRRLQRRGLRDVLPREILLRRGKGISAESMSGSLRAAGVDWMALLANSRVVAGNYVDGTRVKRLFTEAKMGVTNKEGIPLVVFGLESWLRTHEPQGEPRSGEEAFASSRREATLGSTLQ